jgi:flagellar protein FliS
MFGPATRNRGAGAYTQVGQETDVLAASPHRLITLLFEGAMTAINNSLRQMAENDIPARGKSISHAILIIESGLQGALNHKQGGEIADNLDSLYTYMALRLLQANVDNDPDKLKEVHGLLGQLKSSWESIDPSRPPPAAPSQDTTKTSPQQQPATAYRFAASPA